MLALIVFVHLITQVGEDKDLSAAAYVKLKKIFPGKKVRKKLN